MRRLYFGIICLAAIAIASSTVLADDQKFHQTREEMIQELLRKPMKYRSFVPQSQTRSIAVLERKPSPDDPEEITIVGLRLPVPTKVVYEKKTVTIIPDQDIPKLKLKIEFDHDSSAVRSASFYLLKELGMALRSEELKNHKMLVAGYTDSDGSEGYNLRLSVERADTVKQYLAINFDIPEYRLKIRGYGESMPVAANTSNWNKQMNRRVEVWVLDD